MFTACTFPHPSFGSCRQIRKSACIYFLRVACQFHPCTEQTRWEILAFFAYVFIKSAPCISHNCERLRMPAAYAWRKQETQCKVVFDRLLLESVGKLSRRGGGQQPERLEKSGPCWLLKLRWMGTQRVQMKAVLSWLVRWACSANTIDFFSALAALVGPVQHIFFLTVHYFNAFVPIVPASWAGSRAGSPVS